MCRFGEWEREREEHWSDGLSDGCGSTRGVLCVCQGSKAFFGFMKRGVKLEVAAMKDNTQITASTVVGVFWCRLHQYSMSNVKNGDVELSFKCCQKWLNLSFTISRSQFNEHPFTPGLGVFL